MLFNKRKLIPLWFFVLLPGLAVYAQSPIDDNSSASPISFGIYGDYNTRYVWRGFVFSNADVFQPSASITVYNFNLSLWGNIDLQPYTTNGYFNEFDITLIYPFSLWKFDIEPSIQNYNYFHTEESGNTIELGLKLSLPVKDFTFYTLDFIHVKHYPGSYYGELGIGYEKLSKNNFSYGFVSGFGWSNAKFNDAYAGVNKSAFNAVFLNLFCNYRPVESFSFKPRVEVSTILDKRVREASGNNYIVNFGISLSQEF